MRKLILVLMIILSFFNKVFALELSSNSFKHNEFIPEEYTCEGDNVSPHLSWSGFPEGTESFVIICEDPDAPFKTWVHWVIYDIPKENNELAKGIPAQEVLDFGAKQGINDFGYIGYGGPCPPRGETHRYFFRIFALNKKLNLTPGMDKKSLLEAIKEYIIEEAELMGKYRR